MSQSPQDESYLFLVRAYGVQELAVRYFPDVLPASATRHLTRLIRGDGELLDKLTQISYKRGCRIYTPAMVHLIVRYLGLPQHYIFAED